MEKLTIPTSNPNNLRIDKYIADNLEDISRSYAATLCEEGKVTVNGKEITKKYQPKDGDIIEIDLPEPESLDLVPENIPLDILYEDDDLLIITADHGNDPTYKGTDHTRENIPVVFYHNNIKESKKIADLEGFDKIGYTVLENFNLAENKGVLEEIK